MLIKLHKNFLKAYKKLKENERKKFKERRDLFLEDEFHPVLNNHALKGKYLDFRSINITGDLRLIFQRKGNEAIFIYIGSHSKLYG